jgi:hypothetical protein
MEDFADLERRAIEHARRGDFGPAALALNQELASLAPGHEAAWTRLARCFAQAKDLDAAEHALRHVLTLNEQNTIARNLLKDVLRARQFPTTGTIQSGTTGFGLDYFDRLGQSPEADAVKGLAARIDTLLLTVNDLPVAEKIVAARRSAGHSGRKLYRRNSCHWLAGHVSAFHHGGRWEPQFNIGVFSARVWPTDSVRVGIGFRFSRHGMDRDGDAGRQQVAAYFAAFQRAIVTRWRRYLVDWMKNNGGCLQVGDRGPLVDTPADQQIDRIAGIGNPALEEWVFLGRWLHAHTNRDREVLADMRQLTQAIGVTFRDLLPLWTDAWTNADVATRAVSDAGADS